MKIEILYFKDCPGYKPALALLEQVMLENEISAPILKTEITTEELALQHRFLGSPSLRINGKDIEGSEEVSEYGLKCRIYLDTGSGVPSESMLRQALLQAEERA